LVRRGGSDGCAAAVRAVGELFWMIDQVRPALLDPARSASRATTRPYADAGARPPFPSAVIALWALPGARPAAGMAPVDPSLVVSSGSVLIAMTALVLSVRQSRRQNLLPIALDIFRESRSPEWSRARDWVITSLVTEHSPDQGVSGLPEPARQRVRQVVFFYDNLGVFVAYNVIGQDLAIGFHGVGLSEAWSVLEPYIRRERENRGMRYGVFYEDLVCRVRSRPPEAVYLKLKLRSLSGSR
jgi:hypothetical protein